MTTLVWLLLAALATIPARMLATMLMGTAMTILFGFRTIKFFADIRRRIKADPVFDTEWDECWKVSSERFPSENHGSLKTHRFLHLIAAESQHQSIRGAKYEFRIVGVLEKNVITGKWMDPLPHGYYGSFQLIILPTREEAMGLWLGFATNGSVKSGEWIWRRRNSSTLESPKAA